MEHSNQNKGHKYRAIVFFPKEDAVKPMKFENWINDYSLERKQFQRFLDNKHSGWAYFNLYDKNTEIFVKRVKA